jgi:hypothetical protein
MLLYKAPLVQNNSANKVIPFSTGYLLQLETIVKYGGKEGKVIWHLQIIKLKFSM